MMSRRGVLAIFIAVAATPSLAQSVKLSANEIKILLSGNTAVGTWDGIAYRQYFDANGSTVFALDGARSALGEWRVDVDTDIFQRRWSGEDTWESWLVMEYAGAWFWVSKSTPPTPFEMLDGQQLVAE